MKKLLLLTIAASAFAVAPGATGPAGAAAASSCGRGQPLEGMDGETIYLSEITKRRNVSCSGARKAAKNVGDRKLCSKKSRHNGWTVRHVGNVNAISGKFTRGNQSFVVSSQGSC